MEVAADVTDKFASDVHNGEDPVCEPANADLLDCLPIARVDLDLLSDEVSRSLFEAFGFGDAFSAQFSAALIRGEAPCASLVIGAFPNRRESLTSRGVVVEKACATHHVVI